MLDQSERNQITSAWTHSGEMAGRPHVLMRPRLFLESVGVWCALYGENIQDGVAGFGDSPCAACADFDRRWTWSQKEIDACEARASVMAWRKSKGIK